MKPTVCDMGLKVELVTLKFSSVVAGSFVSSGRTACTRRPVPAGRGALEQERQIFAQHIALLYQVEARLR